jgi:FixJ family two-component response regulator
MSGLELLTHLEHHTLRLPTLVLTAHPDVDKAVLSIQRGAIGILQKPPDPGRLRDHCQTMIQLAEAMAVARRELRQLQRHVRTLTERELGVFALLGKGFSTKQVARSLDISIRTAHIHRANVMRKLGAETLSRVAMLAARHAECNGRQRALS